MLLTSVFSLALASVASAGVISPLVKSSSPSFVQVNNAHIFDPPASWASWRVVYHRMIQLNDGSLMSSWENYAPEPPMEAAPIWRSTDGGQSFQNFSQVTDQVNGWGMRYQPFLYVLPGDFADLKAGDLIFAGNSVPSDLSQTKIDVYSSQDGGQTWSFRSSVATGGDANASNGHTPVWEPFLVLYNGQLICYYSDQTDPAHGQKLTHKTTQDLSSWGANTDDMADPDYNQRPGMLTTVQIGSGAWIMTFEYCGDAHGCQVHYKVADTPLDFGSATAQPLVATDGATVHGSPFVTWVYNGGSNGTIIANGNDDSSLYVNTGLAEAGSSWTRVNANTDNAYSRCLHPLGDFDSLAIAGAGNFQSSATPNNVTYSIVSLSELGI